MCSMWMFDCGELYTNGKDRARDLERLYESGCHECAEWAINELRDDKKVLNASPPVGDQP